MKPQVDSEYKQVTEDPRNILYDRMIKAIREVDPEHMIMVEGIWTLSVLPDPEIMEWRNVVYEVHPYGITDTDTECQKYMQYSKKYQVPVYIGEFFGYGDDGKAAANMAYTIHPGLIKGTSIWKKRGLCIMRTECYPQMCAQIRIG